MNNEVHSALSGTQTEQNLHTAFENEATAHIKYKLFADAARRNGNEALARTLEQHSANEYEHAELLLEYLDGIGSDIANLTALIADEEYASEVTYPEFADAADSEGFTEIADKMRAIASAEDRHSDVLEEIYDYMTEQDSVPTFAAMYCPICGYTHNGNTAPERCPLCSRPGINFRPYK